ncbi:isochorismatase family protein [Phytohalomonas tamaricis]|uniref:isochorismatase family protein n=1 Tax=Phytohalomonas tamaricis TaxID=2081032 RepID=UPI000D0B0D3E|nr:isochorismatase family cysteine hydrolase [Phytohalomonas tamaricis]
MVQVAPPWSIVAERSALLVIDMQNDFVREGAPMAVPMARERIPAMQRLVESCRYQAIPVLYTQQVLYDAFQVSPLEVAYQPHLKQAGMRAGSEGIAIIEELAPAVDEVVITKHRYDAFYNTQLETILRNIRGPGVVDTLFIVGTVTNICCESTARSAFMRDFKVVFVSDANGGLDHASHEATLASIGSVFGRVLSTDALIDALH